MKLLRSRLKTWLGGQEARHLRLGKWGEKQAAKFLMNKGYRIIEKRIRIGKRDEIDLVTQQNEALVFVEVKTRSHVSLYRPASAVNKRKQKALTRAAASYIAKMNKKPNVVRFDIIEVIGSPETGTEIHHLEQAFQMNRYRTMKW